MRNLRLFGKSLAHHPGLMWVTFFHALCGLAGSQGGHPLAGIIVGALWWIPVVWTAWEMRSDYEATEDMK